MTNTKRICALLLAAVLCLGLFAACGVEDAPAATNAAGTAGADKTPDTAGTAPTDETAPAGDPVYKISFVTAAGTPVTEGVVVKFMQGQTQAGMQVVNAEGVAEKQLPLGDYTLELQFTDSETEYIYDAQSLTLTGGQTELTVTLSQGLGSNTQSIFVSGKEYEAYHITPGATQISLNAGDMTYFLFTPTESGTYEFSLVGSTAAIGYYGAPHFVQETSAAEVVDNKFTISVRPEMIGTSNTGTTVLVIGVAAGDGNAVLNIERIGEHQRTLEDEPWTPYIPKHTPSAYTLPTGAAIGEFDLTATTDTYKLVKDGNGFYHLDSEDGSLVLVRLGKKAQVNYLDPYETVLEYTGIRCYFYKDAEKKEFEKKEKYEECVQSYIVCVDPETGLYPLTDDLMYIIQNNGNHQGWWELDGNYIFRDDQGNIVPGINADIAWLFMCCYIK